MAVPQNEAAVVRGVAKQSKAAARRAEGMEGNTRTHTARHTHTLDNVFVCAYLSPHPSYSPAYACRRSTQTGNKRRRGTERAKERMRVRARGKKVKTNFSIFTGGREEAATGWQRLTLAAFGRSFSASSSARCLSVGVGVGVSVKGNARRRLPLAYTTHIL